MRINIGFMGPFFILALTLNISVQASGLFSIAEKVPQYQNHQFTSTSLSTVQQWALEKIEAKKALSLVSNGPIQPVLVAVSDTGIDTHHTYLTTNIFSNLLELSTDSRSNFDDDLNGFIDDFYGWNFEEQSNDIEDDFNHGTHVAGIIGAKENSSNGVVGVNPNATLLPIKWMKKGSGWPADAVQTIYYAIKMKARILNTSWGGIGRFPALVEAMKAAEKADLLIIASAGNGKNNNDIAPKHPSHFTTEYSNVIAVGNSGKNDELDPSSNFGKKSVDFAAPGVSILSTIPDSRYYELTGTSMSAAIVSGVASLMLAANPSLTASEIKSIFSETVDPILNASDKLKTPGRINAYRAVQMAIRKKHRI